MLLADPNVESSPLLRLEIQEQAKKLREQLKGQIPDQVWENSLKPSQRSHHMEEYRGQRYRSGKGGARTNLKKSIQHNMNIVRLILWKRNWLPVEVFVPNLIHFVCLLLLLLFWHRTGERPFEILSCFYSLDILEAETVFLDTSCYGEPLYVSFSRLDQSKCGPKYYSIWCPILQESFWVCCRLHNRQF